DGEVLGASRRRCGAVAGRVGLVVGRIDLDLPPADPPPAVEVRGRRLCGLVRRVEDARLRAGAVVDRGEVDRVAGDARVCGAPAAAAAGSAPTAGALASPAAPARAAAAGPRASARPPAA